MRKLMASIQDLCHIINWIVILYLGSDVSLFFLLFMNFSADGIFGSNLCFFFCKRVF